MSIRRGKRPDTRFYTLNKDISEDTRLSWAARGMLIFLLGKPDNWTVSVAHLIKQTADSARPASRDAVRNIIAELVAAGYMSTDTARAENGKFRGMDYVVSESPETDNPSPEKRRTPETEKPSPGEPLPDNPLLIKNDHQQGIKNTASNEFDAAQNGASSPTQNGTPIVLSEQQQADQSATEFQEKCRATWQVYYAAYTTRYGTAPIRNAKINSHVKELVKRLGVEAAPVAEFYVQSVNEQYVVKNFHDIGALVAKAEAYRTQWATGSVMTATRARQIDGTQANASAADEALAMLRAQREREGRV